MDMNKGSALVIEDLKLEGLKVLTHDSNTGKVIRRGTLVKTETKGTYKIETDKEHNGKS